jgi:tetratricopeptide (TPR) repeat protein
MEKKQSTAKKTTTKRVSPVAESKVNPEMEVKKSVSAEDEEEGFEIDFSDPKVRNIAVAVVAVIIIGALVWIFSQSSNTPEQAAVQQVDPKIKELEDLVATNPSYDNYLSLSAEYINKGFYSNSLPALDKALQYNPNSAVAYSNKGFAYAKMGYWGEAKSFVKKALEIDKDFQLAQNNMKWIQGEIDAKLASIKETMSKPKDSISTLEYVNVGLTYASIGMYDECTKAYEKALEKDGNNEIAYNNLGMQLISMDLDRAIQMFEKAIEINPNAPLYRNNLAWAQSLKAQKETPAVANPTEPGVMGSENPDRKYAVGGGN